MFGDSPEVLIVGAGPVGQFAALSLARRGIKVRIVDRGIWPCAQSYALALHPQSLDLLHAAGLLDDVLANSTVQALNDYLQKAVPQHIKDGTMPELDIETLLPSGSAFGMLSSAVPLIVKVIEG